MRRNASIFFFFLLSIGLSFEAVHAAWLDDAQDGIRTAEYHVTLQDGIHQAPNRAQGFRTSFTEKGVLLVPRVERSGMDWTWGLTWVAYGRGEHSWPVEASTLSVQGSRVDYRRGALTEWYENGPRGLKQGFLLPSPPGDGPLGAGEMLHLDLALSGDLAPILAEDRQAMDFVNGKGVRVLRYAELVVTDARGDTLSAWMEGFAREGVRGVRLVVDAHGARFPLTVDPLATSPVWTVEGDQEQAFLGTSVATAGDVNGDGYSDVIVGAPWFDGGLTDQGRAYLFLGSPAGPAATPAWTLEIPQAGAQIGTSVACAGDVNGDGYADVLVGAPGLDFSHTDEGAAAVYFGSPQGLPPESNWGVAGGQAGAGFGRSVAGAGDVDGDGYADILVAAPFQDNGNLDEGRVSLYLGSADGPLFDAAWTTEGNADNVFLGLSAATAGDVNGDGHADVIVGAFGHGGQAGRAVVHHGSAGGLGATAAWFFTGTGTEELGVSVATAGDVNGDGYADVIVGAHGYANGNAFEGRALVFHGSAAGLALAPNWAIEGNGENASLGFSVGTAGDVDGDGYADVIVGAHHHREPGQFSNGRAEVYRGSPTGLGPGFLWRVVGAAETRFGASVGTAGDVNGDGYADVIVGAPHHGGGQFREGRASVFLGSPAGVAVTTLSVESNETGALLGFVGAAGDVNGDGYADVIFGAAAADGAAGPDAGRVQVHLGSATGMVATPAWSVEGEQAASSFGSYGVGTAGDVNGDGYADVVVGANLFDGGQSDEGKAYVFHGSPSGLATTPAWTAEGGQASAYFGLWTGTAGDVNGDGYADVVVGAYGHDHAGGQGRAYVFLGSPSGLSPDPAWIADSHLGDARFGLTVAAAGDVNRDGYGDVLVGAPNATVAGHPDPPVDGPSRAYLYLGGPSGPSPAHAWMVEDTVDSGLGVGLGSAGDVNGDGYADVVLGSPFHSEQRGRAHVFNGTPSGLSPSAAWAVDGAPFSAFGYAAGSAGDVNGDGHADLVVGAPFWSNFFSNEGRAHLYLGSAAGLALTPIWTADGIALEAQFGQSVGTAGDVNGDGRAELLGGAPYLTNGQSQEGRVRLTSYARGVPVVPAQRTADDARPIARQGAAEGPAFRLAALRGRTPFGRGRVKLEAEVKPLGTPFNSLGTVVGAPADTGIAGAPVHALAEELALGTPHHWRVRVLHDPAMHPLGARGPWITIPWGGWNEAMVRTAAPGPAGRASGLILFKVGLGVTAQWASDSGCVEEDTYAIYEGTLGDFTSHVPVDCSTGVSHSWNFTPLAGNRYFLIVPRNASFEGSYGKRGDGAERPASAAACLPQQVACP